eukprot:gene8688-34137_t
MQGTWGIGGALPGPHGSESQLYQATAQQQFQQSPHQQFPANSQGYGVPSNYGNVPLASMSSGREGMAYMGGTGAMPNQMHNTGAYGGMPNINGTMGSPAGAMPNMMNPSAFGGMPYVNGTSTAGMPNMVPPMVSPGAGAWQAGQFYPAVMSQAGSSFPMGMPGSMGQYGGQMVQQASMGQQY